MYTIKVINELTGKVNEYGQPTKEKKDALLDKMIARQYWGKNQREISEESISEELRSRIISTNTIAATEEEDEKIIHLVKADYVVTETNLNLSKKHRNQKKIEARRKEYKSVEEVMHIILDYGLDSEEFSQLQKERQIIKQKYKKE